MGKNTSSIKESLERYTFILASGLAEPRPPRDTFGEGQLPFLFVMSSVPDTGNRLLATGAGTVF